MFMKNCTELKIILKKLFFQKNSYSPEQNLERSSMDIDSAGKTDTLCKTW
jgi:hypothetical protein